MTRKLQIETARVFLPLLQPARDKGAHGGRGCVHPDTLIDTPHGRVKISEFEGGEVYSWENGRIVTAMATRPKRYTEEDLYEVRLGCGRSIIATDEHKFLTSRGWVQLADLSTSDEVCVLRGQENPYHLDSNSELDQPMYGRGVAHWTQTREGSTGRYSGYSRRYGQQPLSEGGISQSWLRSQDDEWRHRSHVSFHADGLATADTGSLSLALFRQSSLIAQQVEAARYCEALGIGIAGKISGWLSGISLQLPRFRGNKILAAPYRGFFRLLQAGIELLRSQVGNRQKPFGRLPYSGHDESIAYPFDKDFTLSNVALIRKHSRHTYWDLHVFGTNNYLSNGIVNHNSGKSHFFAEMLVEDALRWPGDAQEGLRAICGREIQKSLKDSAKFLIESKLAKFGLGEADGFKVYMDKIETPGDGLIIFQGLQDHTTDSIKSFEGFHKFWGEEAHSIKARSMGLIRPTMRWENKRLGMASEMLWSWNPLRKSDAVDNLLRGAEKPTGAVVVEANWRDNPWFPSVLDQERRDCLRLTPDQYGHI